VFQLANANAADEASRTADVAAAVACVPLEQLRALAEAVAVGARFVVPGLSMPQLWRVSLNAAKGARHLAQLLHMDEPQASTAGLLHSVGEVFLHRAYPQQMEELDARSSPFGFGRERQERRALGASFAEAGAEFLRRWKFPLPVEHAVRFQHAPLAHVPVEALASVVHLAAWRARAIEAGFDERESASQFPYPIALALGLDIDAVLVQEPIDWRGTISDAL
jgi:HD-like signal output (HDOD) protein